MFSSRFLLGGGILLIALGILSAFQLTNEWVLLALIGCGGAGLFLVTWSGTKRRRW